MRVLSTAGHCVSLHATPRLHVPAPPLPSSVSLPPLTLHSALFFFLRWTKLNTVLEKQTTPSSKRDGKMSRSTYCATYKLVYMSRITPPSHMAMNTPFPFPCLIRQIRRANWKCIQLTCQSTTYILKPEEK